MRLAFQSTRLERITTALIRSGIMVSVPRHLTQEEQADEIVNFAKLIEARLRAAQSTSTL